MLEMALLLVLVLVLTGLVVAGALVGTFSILFFVLTLPFRIVGWVFHGLGALILFPVFGIVGFVLALAFGIAAFAMLIPILPLALLVAGIVWLARGGRKRPHIA